MAQEMQPLYGYTLAMSPKTRFLTSLGLNFLICKIKIQQDILNALTWGLKGNICNMLKHSTQYIVNAQLALSYFVNPLFAFILTTERLSDLLKVKQLLRDNVKIRT